MKSKIGITIGKSAAPLWILALVGAALIALCVPRIVRAQSTITLSPTASPSFGKTRGKDRLKAAIPPASSSDSAGIPFTGIAEEGPATAPVAIIEFSDFECPFCGGVAPVVDQLLKTFPNKIQFFFMNNPLPFHQHAELAHEAALAAGAQGKFWEMYHLLFSHQKQLDRANLIEYAQQLNLDMTAFQRALDSHIYQPLISQTLAAGKGLGVTGTPTFFINGRKLVGAQTLEALKAAVNQAMAPPLPAPAAQPVDLSLGPPKQINLGNAPVRGSPNAPVTIVEFADFQCPFCGAAVPTLKALLQEYPGRVKLVFKSFPLTFHPDSLLAHQAALAAGAQGKFWEMHDWIFAHQRTMKRADLIQAANSLGLNMTQFLADLDSARSKATAEADRNQGTSLGVTGTPTFFIDGKEHLGAPPLPQFTEIIQRELGSLGKGPIPAVLAKQITAQPALQPTIGNSPFEGPVGAPVTIIWYSDLESPLSPKADALMRQLMSAYPGKIRLVFKNHPLDFHPQAMLAHEAALAAGAQGKFWQMQDFILANQKTITQENLVGYALKLRLDKAKFLAALNTQAFQPAIEDDLSQAKSQGVFGVPAFFINGKRLDGLQPLSIFEQVVNAQLKHPKFVAANK
ncbi:MAG: DsbA family protein [Terriglobia bacterium]